MDNLMAGAAAIPQVDMPNPGKVPHKRTQAPNAYSVFEPGQPSRSGDTPQARAAALGSIVAWLSPETLAHARYQPTASATFCNIYAP